MVIFIVCLVGISLACLLAFNFKVEQSRFEINKLSEHNHKYKTLARFLDIYPGIRVFTHVLSLVMAIILTDLAVSEWGIIGGGFVAFAAILLSWLVARILHGVVSSLVAKKIDFFNKYFSWTEILGRLMISGEDIRIGSESELIHIMRNGDFLDENTKSLVENALSFKDKTVKIVTTPRDKINFVHSRDSLTPKLLDDLFVSGHKIFPVIQNSVDHTIGLLYLDDVLPIEQHEKVLLDVMRRCPPPVDQSAPLEAAIRQMAEYRTPILMVEKDGKIVGLLTMSDVVGELFRLNEQ